MSEHSGDAIQEAEFSRIIRVDHLVENQGDQGGAPGESFSFAAGDDERKALAKRFDLLSLDSLEADVVATRFVSEGRKHKAVSGVRLRVKFSADVIQSCVVTLEPVAAHIAQGFEVDYLPEGAEQLNTEFLDGEAVEIGDGEVIVDVDEIDPPEVLRGDEIDVGEVIAENLSLALDPYPRAVGAEVEADQAGAGDEEISADNPFAVLKELKTSN